MTAYEISQRLSAALHNSPLGVEDNSTSAWLEESFTALRDIVHQGLQEAVGDKRLVAMIEATALRHVDSLCARWPGLMNFETVKIAIELGRKASDFQSTFSACLSTHLRGDHDVIPLMHFLLDEGCEPFIKNQDLSSCDIGILRKMLDSIVMAAPLDKLGGTICEAQEAFQKVVRALLDVGDSAYVLDFMLSQPEALRDYVTPQKTSEESLDDLGVCLSLFVTSAGSWKMFEMLEVIRLQSESLFMKVAGAKYFAGRLARAMEDWHRTIDLTQCNAPPEAMKIFAKGFMRAMEQNRVFSLDEYRSFIAALGTAQIPVETLMGERALSRHVAAVKFMELLRSDSGRDENLALLATRYNRTEAEARGHMRLALAVLLDKEPEAISDCRFSDLLIAVSLYHQQAPLDLGLLSNGLSVDVLKIGLSMKKRPKSLGQLTLAVFSCERGREGLAELSYDDYQALHSLYADTIPAELWDAVEWKSDEIMTSKAVSGFEL